MGTPGISYFLASTLDKKPDYSLILSEESEKIYTFIRQVESKTQDRKTARPQDRKTSV